MPSIAPDEAVPLRGEEQIPATSRRKGVQFQGWLGSSSIKSSFQKMAMEGKMPLLPGSPQRSWKGAWEPASKRTPTAGKNDSEQLNRAILADMHNSVYSSSFVKVLRPRTDPGTRLQINCMTASDGGKIILTGGALIEESLAETGRASCEIGAIHVWRQSTDSHDYGQWHCWPFDPAGDERLSAITCLCLEGSRLVSGHAPKALTQRDDSVQILSAGYSNNFGRQGSKTASGDICVWEFNAEMEDLMLKTKQPSPHGALTAVKILHARRMGVQTRLTTVSAGKVALWTFSEDSSQALELVFTFDAHMDKTLSLAYLPRVYGTAETAPDLLATASNDKTAVIWRLLDGEAELMHKLVHPREVYSADFFAGDDFDPDTEYIATTSHDLSLRLWHVSSGICVHVVKHEHPVMAVDFISNGDMIATGTQSGEVAIFDAMTGIRMRTMEGHKKEIVAVKFLSDFDLLVSSSKDGTLRVWEVMSPSDLVHKLGERSQALGLGGGHGKTVYSMDISSNGRVLATASRDHTVKLWNTCNRHLITTLQGHSNFVFMVAIHPSQSVCATASHDCTIRLWCTETGKCLQTIQYEPSKQLAEDQDDASMAAMYHSKEVSAVTFHPDGKILASASYDKKVILYSQEDNGAEQRWEPFLVLADHEDRIWDLAFSADGMFLASAAWDNTVNLYRTEDLTNPHEFPPAPSEFSADIAVEPSGTIFEDESGLRPVMVHSRRESVMSDNADYKIASLNCLAKVWTVAFQPKANMPLLITGAADHSLRIWSATYATSWKQQAVLEGHTNTVTGVAWHPEGRMFVSSSFDKTVRLWVEKGLMDDGQTAQFQPMGVWSAYSWPTMAVSWSYQPNTCIAASREIGASMLSIATLDGSAYLMDASDAGQQFIPHGRAKHALQQGDGFARDMMIEMVKGSPQTLMSLGHKSGVLMHSVMNECDDLKLAKRLLNIYGVNDFTPLLPYGPKGVPLLASVNNFHGVEAIVDCVVEMGRDTTTLQRNAAAMATGWGTCVMLMLVEKYPDQAVRLLNHIGMVKSNAVVYSQNWNRRRRMVEDGMITHKCTNLEAGRTRYPKALWGAEKKATTLLAKMRNLLPGEDETEPTDVVAMHAAFPYVVGMLPEEYALDSTVREMVTSFMSENGNASDSKASEYSHFEKSFLHLAYMSKEPSLFETPLGHAVLKFKWESYGRRVLVTQAFLFFIQLMAITCQAYALGRMNHGGGWLTADGRKTWELVSLVLAIMVLICSLVQAAYEVLQIRAEGLRIYLGDFWSALDVCCLLLGVSASVLGIVQTFHKGLMDAHATEAVSSVASFFYWIKVLYFLRAFPSTGGLVRMIVQIAFDMRYLLVILAVVLMGAASSFFVLMTINYNPDDCNWEGDWDSLSESDIEALEGCDAPLSFWAMIIKVFGMMLGGFDVTYFDALGSYQLLGQILFVTYLVFQMILLLNLLIALMGDSYEKVQEKANTEALRERAGLLVEIELVMGQKYLERNNYCPRWLHTLVPKESLQTGDSRRTQEWAGITGTIRNDIEGQVSALKASMHDEMEKNAEALLACLQTKIAEQLKGLREELVNQPRFLSPLHEHQLAGSPSLKGRRVTRVASRRPSVT